jgi:signal recognition particle receptor subunit beta
MARIRRDEKLLSFKILYVGAAQSGKSTTVGQLHAGLTPSTRGDLTTSAVTSEATLFFEVKVPDADILPGYASALQVFTVPGEVKYRATLSLLLEGADGIVFVVDSEASCHAENLRAWQQLQCTMADMELSFAEVPLVFQYNKADLPSAVGQEALDGFYNAGPVRHPSFQADALHGIQVATVFAAVSQAAVTRFNERMQPPPEVEPEAQLAPQIHTGPLGPIHSVSEPLAS